MKSNANLFVLIEAAMPADLTSACLITPQGTSYSWNDLLHATAKIAHLLTNLELPKGSRIAVQVDKSPEALILYLATLRAGFIFIPFNTAYQSNEMRYLLQDAQPAMVVCSPKNFGWLASLAFQLGCSHVFTLDNALPNQGSLLQRAAPLPNQFETVTCAPDDIAAIIYTSGTTGFSKGAMLSHHNLSSNARALQKAWDWQAEDVLLHCLPLFHVHGLFISCHTALLSGTKMIFLSQFDAAQVGQFLLQATVFMGVPTYYVRLLEQANFTHQVCSHIRLFISGSAPLLAETFHQFQQRTGHTILERYGMSETNVICSNPTHGQRLVGSVGTALSEVEVRVVDEAGKKCVPEEIGQIQVKGPNVFQGYWNKPEKTAQDFTQDGFFNTGDLGKFDQRSYLTDVTHPPAIAEVQHKRFWMR